LILSSASIRFLASGSLRPALTASGQPEITEHQSSAGEKLELRSAGARLPDVGRARNRASVLPRNCGRYVRRQSSYFALSIDLPAASRRLRIEMQAATRVFVVAVTSDDRPHGPTPRPFSIRENGPAMHGTVHRQNSIAPRLCSCPPPQVVHRLPYLSSRAPAIATRRCGSSAMVRVRHAPQASSLHAFSMGTPQAVSADLRRTRHVYGTQPRAPMGSLRRA